MMRASFIALSFVFFFSASLLNADTLVLRSGKVYRGKFAGGSKRYVNFTTNDGHVTFSCNLDEVLTIQFGPDSREVNDGRPQRDTVEVNPLNSSEESRNGSIGIADSGGGTGRE